MVYIGHVVTLVVCFLYKFVELGLLNFQTILEFISGLAALLTDVLVELGLFA